MTTAQFKSYSVSFFGGSEVRVKRYVDNNTYRGRWEETTETPEVGVRVVYWRCGDDNVKSFNMPPVGGVVQMSSVGHAPEEFMLGRARFRRISRERFTRETAVGDTPDSISEYERLTDELSDSWFYGYALDSSDELSNPAGPYASEEEALAAAGFPDRWAEYPPHLVCGVARRHNDGSLLVGSRLLRGW